MSAPTDWLVDVPVGADGPWRIERFLISKEQSQLAFFRDLGRAPHPGDYTRLVGPGGLWMSDTNAEQRDHWEPLRQTVDRGGDVLVNGLGLGMFVRKILLDAPISSLTIVERSPEVLRLVGPWLREIAAAAKKELRLVEADALVWRPPTGARFSVVWHDIWIAMTEDNIDEMKALHRSYGRRSDWQGSWGRSLIEYRRRQDRDRWGSILAPVGGSPTRPLSGRAR